MLRCQEAFPEHDYNSAIANVFTGATLEHECLESLIINGFFALKDNEQAQRDNEVGWVAVSKLIKQELIRL